MKALLATAGGLSPLRSLSNIICQLNLDWWYGFGKNQHSFGDLKLMVLSKLFGGTKVMMLKHTPRESWSSLRHNRRFHTASTFSLSSSLNSWVLNGRYFFYLLQYVNFGRLQINSESVCELWVSLFQNAMMQEFIVLCTCLGNTSHTHPK